MDGIVASQGVDLFREYQNLLIHDGMVNFGIGSHTGYDEVFVGAYKIFEIYADDPGKYELKECGLYFAERRES